MTKQLVIAIWVFNSYIINTKYIGIHLGERVSNVVYIIGLVTKVDLP